MQERRQSVRVSESFRVSYQVVKSFRMVASRSKDVSEGGIRLPVLQHLQPKMKLDMEIYLDNSGKPIKTIGEVVWIKEIKDLRFPFVVGIKFLKIDPSSLNRLRRSIKNSYPIDQVKLIRP